MTGGTYSTHRKEKEWDQRLSQTHPKCNKETFLINGHFCILGHKKKYPSKIND